MSAPSGSSPSSPGSPSGSASGGFAEIPGGVDTLSILALVAVLVVYWRAFRDNRQRVAFAGFASFLFVLAWGWWGALLLLAESILVFYLGRRLREGRGGTIAQLLACLTVPLAVLVAFKYLFPVATGMGLLPYVAVPLGIAYYSLKHLHFLVESSRGRFDEQPLDAYLSYIFFLPMFLGGPIERFERFSEQAPRVEFSWSNVSLGLERILIGAAKKYVVADFLLNSVNLEPRNHLAKSGFAFLENGSPALDWYHLLFAGFVEYLHFYMDFAGYTDMAIGLGLLFGFRLMENFRLPLLRENLFEFWRSWHISLTSWVRDYVYAPLMQQVRFPVVGLTAAMLVFAAWHGLRSAWLMWGLHHAVGLIVVWYFRRWNVARGLRSTLAFRVLGMVATTWWVSLSFLLTVHMDLLSRQDIIRVYLEALTFGVVS